MSRIRLITWNINSVRARLDIVDRLIADYSPDVLCLQETKVQNHMFPTDVFNKHGLTHHAIAGQKSYHGVATLSKLPIAEQNIIDWCKKGDARHIETRLENGINLHNFYVPAGGDIADEAVNDKFAHKMDFLTEMTNWSHELPAKGKHIVVGDLNIAPLESDVWSHKKLLKVVSHTPKECDAMMSLMEAHDWYDVMRHFVPEPERLYSWWSYRSKDWKGADKGRRLDHVWCSPTLKSNMKSMQVLEEVRGWIKPSDHAPVLVEIEI
ncbi:MAG: exodeoxyribonuclease III [Emcibacteraceae bacterium]|nr:exodeoxyribonuclease III [Emcibacteraceae bacterium]MDG1996054.1 exodeoxyribonuclease III [Emcibacteraceae bacterium]